MRFKKKKESEISNLGAAPAVQRARTNSEHSIQTGERWRCGEAVGWQRQQVAAVRRDDHTAQAQCSWSQLGGVAPSVLRPHSWDWDLPSRNRTGRPSPGSDIVTRSGRWKELVAVQVWSWVLCLDRQPPLDGCSNAVGWGKKSSYTFTSRMQWFRQWEHSDPPSFVGSQIQVISGLS